MERGHNSDGDGDGAANGRGSTLPVVEKSGHEVERVSSLHL